jgi:hypothetical protein
MYGTMTLRTAAASIHLFYYCAVQAMQLGFWFDGCRMDSIN